MGRPLHVLIVEDSEGDALLMVGELRRKGFDVTHERVDTAEAMEAVLDRQNWDVVLSDDSMPHFNSFKALELVKRKGLDLPFIIVSGSIGEDMAVAAMKAGTHDYIMKNNLTRLVPAIERELEEVGVRRDRKRAEEALKESEKQFRSLFDEAPVGYFEYDSEGRIANVNRTELEMLGYSLEEMMGRPVWEFIVEEDEARHLILAKLGGTLPASRGLERTYRRKDGTTFPALVQDRLLRDAEGRIIGIRATIQDITERKLAEESLKQSEENARQLAQENAIMAEIGRIISSTLNIEETYEAFSAEVKKIIPFDRIVINMINTEGNTVRNVYISGKELPDRNVKDVYPLEGSGNAEMVRTKSTLLIQTDDFNEYKDRFPMLLSTFHAGFRSIMNVPLFSKGKIIGGLLLRSHNPHAYTEKDVRLAERIGSQIAGAIANAQLYAERIQAEAEKAALEEQFRQAQKMEAIGQFAGGIAHDFNNLLTVIKGYGQLCLMELGENSPLGESIKEIEKAADGASNLVRQLLAFSRRQVLEIKVLDLNSVLRNLDKMLRRVIGEDVELVARLAEDLWRVKNDPGQVEQVVMNLAVNARDAMPNGGKLTIETTNVELSGDDAGSRVGAPPGRYVMLCVTDTGAGMTSDVRERVFEPFFTTKEKGRGTGLGLSTVYGIVKQTGGYICVHSEIGNGTTFTIYLPRVDEPAEDLNNERRLEPVPRGSETVLIIEDEEVVRRLAVLILSKHGYKVLDAPNGGEAFLVLDRHKEPIHLILTDVVMPKMSGPEFIDRLREIRNDFKVLYTSGYMDESVAHHGVQHGRMDFLQKPFTYEVLARKVREVLDKCNAVTLQ